MADHKPLDLYRTQQVMTASPARLVAMLFDKAITSLKEAIAAIAAGDIEKRWRSNNRAIEIITHLWSTLDQKRGGEIAEVLAKLYSFTITRLIDVDFKNDPQPAHEAIKLLEPLRDSWNQLAANGGPAAPAQPASAQGAPATAEGAQPPAVAIRISA